MYTNTSVTPCDIDNINPAIDAGKNSTRKLNKLLSTIETFEQYVKRTARHANSLGQGHHYTKAERAKAVELWAIDHQVEYWDIVSDKLCDLSAVVLRDLILPNASESSNLTAREVLCDRVFDSLSQDIEDIENVNAVELAKYRNGAYRNHIQAVIDADMQGVA